MPFSIPLSFTDIEVAIYGRHCPRFSQNIETINGFHALLQANYPGLHCQLYHNTDCRLISYELPGLQFDGTPAAYFGYWESQNDIEAARDMFERCARDLKARAIRQLIGPINFSTFFDYRIRLDHFERLNYPGEPHNPPYYAPLLEQCDFRLVEKYFSVYTPSVTEPLQRLHKKAGRIIDREHPFSLVPLHQFDVEKYLPQVYQLLDLSFREALAYVPLTETLFKQVFNSAAIAKYCPTTSCVALLNDEPVGLLLSLPDWAELSEPVKAAVISGAATLDAKQHLDQLVIRRAYIKTVCVKPELRNSGLYVHLFVHFLNNCQNLYEESGGALMRLGNAANKLGLELFDDAYSTRVEYGLYAKTLE